MAPMKKYRRTVSELQPRQSSKNQGAISYTINVDVTESNTLGAPNNRTSLQQSSRAMSTQPNYLTDTKSQAPDYATYQYTSRSCTQDASFSNSNNSTTAMTPMERWQYESIHDEPWHAIESIYVHEGGDTSKEEQYDDTNVEQLNTRQRAEDQDSMAGNASDIRIA